VDEKPVERRLAAVLHADVAGYSRLMGSDEEATVRAVRAQRGIVEGVVRQHRGRVADFTGDAFLAEFPSAVDAVSAALTIQRESALLGAAQPEERRFRLRIAVHAGEVRVDGETIYGDAIHIAARLQTLAEPGGLCLSSTIQEQLGGKLPLRLRDLGPQVLKNIARPVHAFAVSLDHEAAATPGPVPGFSGRPAIAVLPFDNLSGDPEQAYFCDGIAEDLITRLATLRDFPVIARNSSFAYKGRAVDVKKVGAELGVAYLVEGSVRRAAGRVRITAQLVEAKTGHHLWAERFDRELEDVFAIQDEIVDAIVARVYPEVMRAERERAGRQDPARLSAWELALRARDRAARWTREGAAEARGLALRALELDPGCVDAAIELCRVAAFARQHHWDDLIERDGHRLVEGARVAMRVAGESWAAWLALGRALREAGDLDEAIRCLRRALELNPSANEVLLFLATTLAWMEHGEEALALLETARRLDPTTQEVFYHPYAMAFACFSAGRYADATAWAEQASHAAPGHVGAQRLLAACLAESGRAGAAAAGMERLRRAMPGLRMSELTEISPGAAPSFIARYAAALRKAGVPG
jgi:adenylate cyclase